jgi:hypothetical protein
MLSPARLRALAEIEASNAKVLSFYMQLSPDRRVGRAWHTVFSSLRDRTLKAIDDRRQRQGVQDEFDKVEQAGDWGPWMGPEGAEVMRPAAEVMKTALKAATRGSHDSAKIAKIREILERAK